MENTNVETAILDVLRSPEGEIRIRRIVDARIKEIMASSGLSEIEVLRQLRGGPAAGL